MFGRTKKPLTADEMREQLARDSVPYYEIPSIDGHTSLPDHIDPTEYEESAARALRLAKEATR